LYIRHTITGLLLSVFSKEGVKKRQKNFAYDLEGDMGKRCLAEI
jgi:hypothetical protein